MTIVYYNVVGSSSGGSNNLYIGFEAVGTQPINVEFSAATSTQPAVSYLQYIANSHFNSLSLLLLDLSKSNTI